MVIWFTTCRHIRGKSSNLTEQQPDPNNSQRSDPQAASNSSSFFGTSIGNADRGGGCENDQYELITIISTNTKPNGETEYKKQVQVWGSSFFDTGKIDEHMGEIP